jgi:hypothetical protein
VSWELDGPYDGEEWSLCECGVTLGSGEGPLCYVCAGAPHGRECPCDDCERYWAGVAEPGREPVDGCCVGSSCVGAVAASR